MSPNRAEDCLLGGQWGLGVSKQWMLCPAGIFRMCFKKQNIAFCTL